ncbi:MAG: hypothetical protein ABIR06_03990 [Cyclobacteriaceae bacterium]
MTSIHSSPLIFASQHKSMSWVHAIPLCLYTLTDGKKYQVICISETSQSNEKWQRLLAANAPPGICVSPAVLTPDFCASSTIMQLQVKGKSR